MNVIELLFVVWFILSVPTTIWVCLLFAVNRKETGS